MTSSEKGQAKTSKAVERERPKKSPTPLVANLAVSKKLRRRGVGAKLVRRTEACASEWEYDEIVLLVDAENEPAQRLYNKLGYETLWRVGGASKIDVTDTVRTVRATNVAMAKELGQRRNPLEMLLTSLNIY
mmetsp:Transcript_11908/g.15670  ORF Transcript_11908/g.15670 Transcript_11908/m.15670 type:complete len:132 (-) Transcript_11908:385-780(-)|eukprot:CAMPEP_0185753600 /NCGR_PEP_ID=MMETSP1174-20130828/12329_1 /TAXON_ID=35687 /ORGANISM="Dictyocha speculum, Strain CCMP1381" /LENGTH=131 /DNA_ID=CAMNT_0028431525 /DNA_START=611 /DNA_END=1006 /DNA_ORIENTATION=-